MAEALIDNITSPGTPAAGQSFIWADSTTKKLICTDDAGIHRGMGLSHNQMLAASGVSTSVDTYLTNSGILIPSFGIQVGQMYLWRVGLSKTAAGTTAGVVTARIGSLQSVSDTSLLALTQTVAQTATAWSAILDISLYVTVASASGIVAGVFGFNGGGTAFGSGKDAQSGAIDLTGRAGQYIGISLNAATSGVWTWTGVWARLLQ